MVSSEQDLMCSGARPRAGDIPFLFGGGSNLLLTRDIETPGVAALRCWGKRVIF